MVNKDNVLHIPIPDWQIRFHKTILLYNHIIGNFNRYDALYQEEVRNKFYDLPISIPSPTPSDRRGVSWVKYDTEWNRWLWASQMEK